MIPPVQKLEIKKTIKAAVPADVDDGISHGTRQAIVCLRAARQRGVTPMPVGAMDGAEEQYYSDLLFFYDDPHKIYVNWPKDVWAVARGWKDISICRTSYLRCTKLFSATLSSESME